MHGGGLQWPCEVKNRIEIASSAASSAPHLFYGCLQGTPFFAFWIFFYAYPDVSRPIRTAISDFQVGACCAFPAAQA